MFPESIAKGSSVRIASHISQPDSTRVHAEQVAQEHMQSKQSARAESTWRASSARRVSSARGSVWSRCKVEGCCALRGSACSMCNFFRRSCIEKFSTPPVENEQSNLQRDSCTENLREKLAQRSCSEKHAPKARPEILASKHHGNTEGNNGRTFADTRSA